MLTILIEKILSLALILGSGFLLIRWRAMSEEDSRSLSRLCVKLVMPCSIFSAFQMPRSPEILARLGLTLLAAILLHLMMMGLLRLLKKPLRLTPVEQASVLYTNAGNLVIPLVAAMLGPEWVIYTSAYILVMTVLTWSHGKALICGENATDWAALLKNPNILALIAGCTFFLLDIRLPGILGETLSGVGGMVGPLSMLVTGMLLGTLTARQVLGNRRVWLVTALRLGVCSLACVGLLVLLGKAFPAAAPCFLVTLLSAVAPSANLITHIAQLYGGDSPYASAISVVTTLLCAATIPIMAGIYLYIFPL